MEPSAVLSLERDWKAGLLSLRILKIKYSLSEDMIKTLAAENEWGSRAALRDQIDRSAMRALIDRTVSDSDVSPTRSGVLIDEQGQVDAYGQILAGVLQSHQRDIGRGRTLANEMMGELEALAPVRIDLDAIGAMADAVEAEGNTQLAKSLRLDTDPHTIGQKMSNLQRRLGMLQTVSGIHATYIPLEREAWGMNRMEDENKESYEELLDAVRRLTAQ